jgi:16S rRNA (cytosine967-C5)-methyltransferase
MKVSPARAAALDALLRIETENAFSSIVLPLVEANLSPNDRSLCHETTLGVLRRKLYLDHLIDELSNGRKLDAEVRVALRIGLFQMLFLDRVPAHSAINEGVELVSRAKKSSAKGFVNALLRKFQREPFDPKYNDSVEEISILTSHPRWLVERWISRFGIDETRALCESNNRTPILSFRLVGTEKEKSETLGELEPNPNLRRSEFVDGCFLASRIDGDLLKLAEAGRIYFQDEGSQLVANAVIAEGGSRILDVCAAPGGKTTVIASATNTSVVAGDIRGSRVQRLRDLCEKQKAANVSIVQYDAESSLPFDEASFDSVFVDVPCSGTGTIRHNPEIRYSLASSDLEELSDKQLRILRNASEMVKPGGTLIYSTCSMETEENEVVCERFLREGLGLGTEPPKVPSRFITSQGFARTSPHRDDMDGFFIAVFLKKQ